MVKRLSKSRRSAILEHLLALEKQIRAEFGGDGAMELPLTSNPDTDLRRRSSASLRHGELEDRTRVISNEFTARSMH